MKSAGAYNLILKYQSVGNISKCVCTESLDSIRVLIFVVKRDTNYEQEIMENSLIFPFMNARFVSKIQKKNKRQINYARILVNMII